MLFGHSRGEFEIPRIGAYEKPIFALLDAINPDNAGYMLEYENDTFVMHPYWWGDCDCGFEEKEEVWDEENKHTADCFHTLYHAEKERISNPKIQFMDSHELMTVWSKANGLPTAPDGMAVYCTCDYQERWEKFTEANWHDAKCSLARPNFLFKPTGYELRVYKYPMRDSFANYDLSTEEYAEMMDVCIKSLEA